MGYLSDNLSSEMDVLVSFVFCIIATVCVTVSAFIPGWFVLEYTKSSYRVYMNLFYGVVCDEGSCVLAGYYDIYRYNNRPSSDSLWLISFQIEVILTIVISVITVAIQKYYTRGNKSHRWLLASLILCLIGGLLILVSCGRVLTSTLNANTSLHTSGADYYYDFPFSLVPAGIGGFLSIIAAILLYVVRRQVLVEDNPDSIVFYRTEGCR